MRRCRGATRSASGCGGSSSSRRDGDNRYFGRLDAGDWRGTFFKHAKFPRRWSPVSRFDVTDEHWREAWRDLWTRIDADQMDVLKRSASGDVLEGEIALGGRPVNVIVKRPRRKYWHRYLTRDRPRPAPAPGVAQGVAASSPATSRPRGRCC